MNVSVRANVRTAQAAKQGPRRRPGHRLPAPARSPACWWSASACWASPATTSSCAAAWPAAATTTAPRAGGDGGAGLRRLADLDLRPARRRHLHQGRRRRRRPGGQGRGRHPRGRPPQPRRDRRQRGRQRRRLRRHGRRPVRDLRGDHRRHHAAGGDLLHRRGPRPHADAAARHRRHLHPHLDRRHLFRQARPRQRHHEGAVQGPAGHRRAVGRRHRHHHRLVHRLQHAAAADRRRHRHRLRSCSSARWSAWR